MTELPEDVRRLLTEPEQHEWMRVFIPPTGRPRGIMV